MLERFALRQTLCDLCVLNLAVLWATLVYIQSAVLKLTPQTVQRVIYRTSSFMGQLANTSRQFPSAVSARQLRLLICSMCKRERTCMAALSFDFGRSCSFGFGLWFRPYATHCDRAPSPSSAPCGYRRRGGVALCNPRSVSVVFQYFALPAMARRTEVP